MQGIAFTLAVRNVFLDYQSLSRWLSRNLFKWWTKGTAFNLSVSSDYLLHSHLVSDWVSVSSNHPYHPLYFLSHPNNGYVFSLFLRSNGPWRCQCARSFIYIYIFLGFCSLDSVASVRLILETWHYLKFIK